jgi:trehalose 6-phosphate synthase
MADTPRRLVVVSNRLPVVVSQENGRWQIQSGSGGLITALAPVLRRHSGLWIGWPGAPPEAPLDRLLAQASEEAGYTLHAVGLDEDLIHGYYSGFSNEILWPLFHDMLGRCVFSPAYWGPYREANRRFAETIAEATEEEDFIWVQDYHLILVAQALRELGVRRRAGFFLHIPFPTSDLFRRLPWRLQIIGALLEYEVIGFQTEHDRRNFVRTVRELLPGATMEARRRVTAITVGGHRTLVGHFPIGIDYDAFQGRAKTPEVAEAAWLFHENLPRRKIVLGVDRLDYTKGVRRRMHAFEMFFEKYPELQREVSLVQIVVPSRTEVPEYQQIQREIEHMVGHINGKFSREGWVPIFYEFRSVPLVELLGAYRASEIMLVTPLRDGMNLVAKEYCASHVTHDGVLILSEFAGAAAQLGEDAILVNPNDLEGIADAIHHAYTMTKVERTARMKRLRAKVRRQDVHWWARIFLRQAGIGE